MKKFILAAAAIAVAVLGFGGLRASTTYAAPSKIYVINGNVAAALNAGPVTWTAAGLTDGNVASFGTWDAASADQINTDIANAGSVYIVVQTDGSATGISLNGRGLVCATVVGGAAACDGVATSVPVTVGTSGKFSIWQVTGKGSFTTGVATALQDATSLDSKALSLVGQVHDVQLTVSKATVQEGAAACAIAASQSAPTNGLGSVMYTDLGGNSLVGYMPTFKSSATATLLPGGTAAGQQVVTMLQSDGKTIAGVDSYCGVAAGSATLSAAPTSGEDTILAAPAGFARTAAITVTGVPASIALTASPAVIACDGTQTSTVTAKVTDSAGNNVVDNTPVNFSVVALGTSNPINTKTKAGEASTTVTPLSGATAGVTVIVTSGDVQASIRVDCSLPVPTPTSSAPSASPTPGTGITGPNTGTGGYLGQDAAAGFPMWTLVALVLGSLVLVSGGIVTRRAGK